VKLVGKVFSGMGMRKDYLSKKPYQKNIKSIIGHKPLPGTLKFRCSKEEVGKVLDQLEAEKIQSFKFKGEKYSAVNVCPAKLQDKTVAVLRMEVTDYSSEVVEVVAEDNLRREIGLEDADEVCLRF
jgi:CTP-dependent riboflavin kinase